MNNDKELLKNDEKKDNETNRTANDHIERGGAENPGNLSTQGKGDELRTDLGGATNLSLDQLKEDDGQPADEGTNA